MRVSQAFLVNTKNFDTIIDTLASYDGNKSIDTKLIKELGYSDPNDLLVVRLLKDLEIINSDGLPDKYFEEFRNPKTTKVALAKGLLTAYEHLFDENTNIHKAAPEKVKEAFENYFGNKKTELIIKYMSGTFQCIVSYCGIPIIDAIQNGKDENHSAEVTETVGAIETSAPEKNGTYERNGIHEKNGIHKNGKRKAEEISDKTIDDLIFDFNTQVANQDKVAEHPTVYEPEKELHREKVQDPFDFINENGGMNLMTENEKFSVDNDPFDLNTPLSEAARVNQINDSSRFIRKALFRKSDLLYKMQRWERLLPTLEEIINRYDSGNPNVEERVARTIIHRAVVLLKLKRIKEALPALDTVIDRFKDAVNPEFYHKASMAMLYKAQVIENNGGTELLSLYNAIIDRLDSNPELAIKEKLDEIHLKRFDLIIDNEEPEEVLDASSKLISRFKDRGRHSEYLQRAMIQRAEILDKLNRDEEALEAYDEFLTTFG